MNLCYGIPWHVKTWLVVDMFFGLLHLALEIQEGTQGLNLHCWVIFFTASVRGAWSIAVLLQPTPSSNRVL